jgi:molecular chaperone HscB
MTEQASKSQTTRGRDLCQLEGRNGEKRPFCDICVKLKNSAGENSFAIMALETRMSIDLEQLEANYHRLSRELHPDFHRDKPEKERLTLLQRSADVNNAYKTLKDPVRRTSYLLRLLGCQEGEPSRQVPASLTDTIFEIQDLLGSWAGSSRENVEQTDALREQLEERREFIRQERRKLIEELLKSFGQWDELIDVENEKETGGDQHAESGADLLRGFQEKVNRWSYLDRLWQQLSDALVS